MVRAYAVQKKFQGKFAGLCFVNCGSKGTRQFYYNHYKANTIKEQEEQWLCITKHKLITKRQRGEC